ncbi:MAG TPA: alpha/beta hydrolase [Tepidisphaeraceae bacterium]|nr:alpha/beta hydrolase [Tepidisphaeraceae bacterium]
MLKTREYGTTGPVVIVLHGGPAAIGEATPIAQGLAGSFRVLEPWQRGSGEEPLTVAQHVADLHHLITARGIRPALVGESWGAMLALAYAAAQPDSVVSLVLVGCGTFDPIARARLHETLEQRMTDALRQRLDHLPEEFPDPAERIGHLHKLLEPLYTYAPMAIDDLEDDSIPPFDLRAHTETWADMLRLQEAGVYPPAFAAIRCPVLMLHGAYDPHPGGMIRASLQPYLPQLEYRQWEQCGHSPWREQAVRNEFFAMLRGWLGRQFTQR